MFAALSGRNGKRILKSGQYVLEPATALFIRILKTVSEAALKWLQIAQKLPVPHDLGKGLPEWPAKGLTSCHTQFGV